MSEEENKENIDEKDDTFNWQEFLESTKSFEVPQTLFLHVEESVLNRVEPGMCLEVLHGNNFEHFWPASINLACGSLLRLRFLGLEDDRTQEFWCDLTKVKAYPLGYSTNPYPPSSVHEKLGDNWKEWIQKRKTQVISVPVELLSGDGCTPIDRIKTGMKMLIQDKHQPYNLWIANVIENIGGRLLLRYLINSSNNETKSYDEWMFYTSSRLFPIDWVETRGIPWQLEPPATLKNAFPKWKETLQADLDKAKQNPMPKDLFNSYVFPEVHNFKEGMVLEILPNSRKHICSGIIFKIIDDKYFLVKTNIINELFLCTKDCPFIFPIGYANKYNLPIIPPPDWIDTESKFTWTDYLIQHNNINVASEILFKTQNILDEFNKGMMLEAADPLNPNIICASTIGKVIGHLLVINLNCQSINGIIASPSELYPVGWCESNSYPLSPPNHALSRPQPPPPPANTTVKHLIKPNYPPSTRSCWCPKIYFNHKCFSGPFISKGKLAGLPKSVGPGPITLVLREVLGMIISVAYKSSRVLKELQTEGKSPPGSQLEVLKAKYKTNTYRANVAIVTSADQIPEFCRNVCRRLQLCPYLFGPTLVESDGCPEKCSSLSKTRFTHYITRDNRKPGRPPNTHNTPSALQPVNKPKGKRGRKRLHPPRTTEPMEVEETTTETTTTLPPNNLISVQKLFDSENNIPSDHLSSPETKSIAGDTNDIDIKLSNVGPIKLIVDSQTKEFNGDKSTVMKKEYIRTGTTPSINDSHVRENFLLETNPLHWSEDDVYKYLIDNTNCSQMAERCKDEMIDGHAFMLLTLPTIRENLQLRLGMAMKLCCLVERVKLAYYMQYLEEESLAIYEP